MLVFGNGEREVLGESAQLESEALSSDLQAYAAQTTALLWHKEKGKRHAKLTFVRL